MAALELERVGYFKAAGLEEIPRDQVQMEAPRLTSG